MSNPAIPFAAELESESVATRRLLERVPADRLAWRPHPKAMSLGQLALHVAGIPGRMTEMARKDGFDASRANFEPASPTDASELLPLHENGVAAARDFLKGLDDSGASAQWRLSFGDREIRSMPRIGMIRSLMLNHLYHHRGQLAVYLRILDVPVPATYGRSADESPFAEA